MVLPVVSVWISELPSYYQWELCYHERNHHAVFRNAGSVSHADALEKARVEYRKCQEKMLTPVEEAYLEGIKSAEKEVKACEKAEG